MDPVALLSTLGNKYNPEILQTTYEPKSAQELSEELDIPIATSYRRVEQLQELGLLEQEGKEFSDEGRQRKVYRRNVDEIVVELGNGDLDVDTTERTEAKNALNDVWSDLRG
ncbi:helix-turn-helix domain-containing protein [Salinarchaeum chitinilyticum]